MVPNINELERHYQITDIAAFLIAAGAIVVDRRSK
mgnify:CR=1 FL=1